MTTTTTQSNASESDRLRELLAGFERQIRELQGQIDETECRASAAAADDVAYKEINSQVEQMQRELSVLTRRADHLRQALLKAHAAEVETVQAAVNDLLRESNSDYMDDKRLVAIAEFEHNAAAEHRIKLRSEFPLCRIASQVEYKIGRVRSLIPAAAAGNACPSDLLRMVELIAEERRLRRQIEAVAPDFEVKVNEHVLSAIKREISAATRRETAGVSDPDYRVFMEAQRDRVDARLRELERKSAKLRDRLKEIDVEWRELKA